MRAPPFVGLCLWLALPAHGAAANIRQRVDDAGGRSTALHGAAPGVTVLHEDLRFDCHGRPGLETREHCRVEATYVMQVESAVTLACEFILPVSTDIVARVGSASPLTVAVTPLPPREPGRRRERAMFGGKFAAALAPGRDTITVSYDEDAGAFEAFGPAYFRNSRYLSIVEYELWPLKEWKLAPDFQLRVSVLLDSKPPRWWNRAATRRHATCIGLDQAGNVSSLAGLRETQAADRLQLEVDLPPAFPDRLRCANGEQRDLGSIREARGDGL